MIDRRRIKEEKILRAHSPPTSLLTAFSAGLRWRPRFAGGFFCTRSSCGVGWGKGGEKEEGGEKGEGVERERGENGPFAL